MKKKWILTLAVTGLLFCSLQSRLQAQALVIEGGTLIDGNGGTPLKDAVVVIEGNRFKAAGARGTVTIPANAKVIKADGKTILPGLIDSHIHVREWMPPMFLRYGVTTIYDLTNYTGWIIAEREAQRKGKLASPRIFVTGRIVDGPLDYYGGRLRLVDTAGERFHYQNLEDFRAAVRSLAQQGVDAIKITEAASPDQIAAATDEASKFGLQVCGHATSARISAMAGLKCIAHLPPIIRATITEPAGLAKVNALKQRDLAAYFRGAAGSYDSLMEPAQFGPLAQLLVEKGVFLNITLANEYADSPTPRARQWAADAADFVKNTPGIDFIPADIRRGWVRDPKTMETDDANRVELIEEGHAKIAEFIRTFVKAGGKITAGTDRGDSVPGRGLSQDMIPFIPGLGMHQEMESLVEAGMTPMQVILSSTKYGAEMFHKEKELGTIEPGKLADLIIINGDPLADIKLTRSPDVVVLDGKVVNTSLDPHFVNPLPRPFNTQNHGPSMGPEMTSFVPETEPMGIQPVTLEITGSKFTAQSVVRFDTSDLKTQFVSETKLTGVIDRAHLEHTGTFPITVVNPGSGGATSNTLYFIVGF